MTAIVIRDFGGRVPITGDRLIPDNAATVAVNTDVLSGELRGIHAPGALYTFQSSSPTYKKVAHFDYNGQSYWFGLNTPDSDIVRSPLANDAYGRYYMVDPGTLPRLITQDIVQNGGTPFLLGVPAPTGAPVITPAAETGATGEIVTTRAYCYTYVTAFGEESAPSLTSEATGDAAGAWTVSGMVVAVDNLALRNITSINLYRTVTGSDGSTAFYLVGNIITGGATTMVTEALLNDSDGTQLTDFDGVSLQDNGQIVSTTTPGTYTDIASDTLLTNNDIALPSTYWLPPLAMDGLISNPGGFLIGWSGRNIYASAVGFPHAWPYSYALALESNIIGMALSGTNVIVMTETTPRQLSGTTPDSLAIYDYGMNEPCQSKGSIVAFPPAAVLYASQNGLVTVDWIGAHISTSQLMERDVWITEYNPTQIQAVRQGTKYVAFNGAGTGFIFDNQSPRIGFIDTATALGAPNVSVDYGSGDAIVFVGNTAYRWNDVTQPQTPWRWMSKQFQFPSPLNIGAWRVEIDDTAAAALPPVNAIEDSLLPDGVALRMRAYAGMGSALTLIADISLNVTTTGRFPSGFKADTWQFEFIGQVSMRSFKSAETSRELDKV